MIQVSVLYPSGEGKRFDMVYYLAQHIPLVKQKLGVACKGITVIEGLAGGAPGAAAPFVAMAHLACDSLESFQAAFAPHAATIMGDIPNYTNIEPIVQIGTVKG